MAKTYFNLLFFFFWGMFTSVICAQDVGRSDVPINRAQVAAGRPPLERMFYSLPYQTLEDGILEASKRHALYSYLIANFATPGIDYYEQLPEDDKIRLSTILGGSEMDQEVFQEFVLARFAENSRRYNALITMWGGKKNALTKVVTLGK